MERKIIINGKELKIITNKFAKQADSSVWLEYGKTTLLITVTTKKSEENDFFPLVINYEEKLYAVGKIPGNYNRREGRASINATLAARLIDRPLRPLFPEGYNDEVQVVCTVLSLDLNDEPDILGIIGSSIALLLAKSIPFNISVAAVNVGMIDDKFIINPTLEQQEISKLNLKIAGTKEAINMVECSSDELDEQTMIEALMFGHEEIKKINQQIENLIEELKIKKEDFIYEQTHEEKMIDEEIKKYDEEIKIYLNQTSKEQRNIYRENLLEKIRIDLSSKYEEMDKIIIKIFNQHEENIFRKMIIDEKKRVDGRKLDQIRKLEAEINLLPMAHGSSLFTRGETQALATSTLGLKIDAQLFDGLEKETEKRFLLHYNFPPYSVGEVGRIGAPSRREIGHGHLAEMALEKVLPSIEEFPYTIRVVSEILESNGSSSQATICAGSLALMAAGVPIKEHVAGIAMGLIKEENNYTILTDIQGLEDHLGDMDFKVSGTKKGICAIQMDIKTDGITKEIFEEALLQAKKARLEILDLMNSVINKPQELSEYAPKQQIIMIKPEKIRDVIGKNGDTINKIIEQTNVKIDIEDDGKVFIYSQENDKINEAINIILKIIKEYEVGEKYQGKITRIENYGMFITFDDDQEILIHISQIANKRIENIESFFKINDKIDFEIIEIDKNKMKGKLSPLLNIDKEKDEKNITRK